MMRASLICLGFALTGCAQLTGPQMSAEQLAAAAKDKNASVACGTGTGPWGKINTVYVNIDKNSVTNGSVAVDAECKITITTANTAPKAAP